MMRNMRRGIPNLFKQGTTDINGSDESVIYSIHACHEQSELARTSLGPQGMYKMILNNLDKVIVTSDSVTILHEAEVEHPAAKLLVEAAKEQEREIGDGSNWVLTISGELLNNSENLIRLGIPSTAIAEGYRKAIRYILEITNTLIVKNINEKDLFNEDILAEMIKSSISSKQYGLEDILSKLVAKACTYVMPYNTYNLNVDDIRVVKIFGSDIHQSFVLHGMVLQLVPHTKTVHNIQDATIAVFTCTIDAADTETKGTALITSAEELSSFNLNEEKQIERQILDLKDSNINVVVTSSTVSDLATHYLEKYNIMCIRVTSSYELRRLCRAVHAQPLVTLGYVPIESRGYCSRVYVKEIGLNNVTIFEQEQNQKLNSNTISKSSIATIVLRSSTNTLLNDVERAIDDGINTIKSMGKQRGGSFVAGAGAFETELSRKLSEYAVKEIGTTSYCIEAFAEALLVIPRTLAENAGYDPIETVSTLIQSHESGKVTYGINAHHEITNEKYVDAVEKGIFDLYSVKAKAIDLVYDTVSTILKIEQIIQCKPAGGPKLRQRDGHWDDEE